MALSGSQLKEIQQALLSAYPTKEHLAIMVRFELDKELDTITGGNDLTVITFTLIRHAESNGYIRELVNGAYVSNEGNQKLKELVSVIDTWLEPVTPKPPQQAVNTPPEKLRQPFEPEMVLIPAGYFLMGSDPIKDELAHDDEFPLHSLYLPDYYIGKKPVTNYQYWIFVRAAGYTPPEHWENGELPRDKADHPVVNVNWLDWLSGVTGRAYQLPTEAEWEKAARGTDGRIYPWGDNAPTDKLCNFKGYVGDTTPVGKYPAGANGLFDMAGNVWEWTSTWGPFRYPYNAEDGREDMEAADAMTLRGGAWDDPDNFVRCAYRHGDDPNLGEPSWGFRVAVESSGF